MNDQTTLVLQALSRDVGELQERLHHMEMMFMQLIGGLAEAGVIQVAEEAEVDDEASARGTGDEVVEEEKESRIILP
tara:strand:- start:142 stop:372 length:231 start_codon:yes stop_codon:yes gene_type:complete